MTTNSMRSVSLTKKFLDQVQSGQPNKTTMEIHTPLTKSDALLPQFLNIQLINKVEPFVIRDSMVMSPSVTTMVISLSLIITISKRLLLFSRTQENGAKP